MTTIDRWSFRIERIGDGLTRITSVMPGSEPERDERGADAAVSAAKMAVRNFRMLMRTCGLVRTDGYTDEELERIACARMGVPYADD